MTKPKVYDYVKIKAKFYISNWFNGHKVGSVIQIRSRSQLFSVMNELDKLDVIPREIYESPLYKTISEIEQD